jgi:hypothetical protein
VAVEAARLPHLEHRAEPDKGHFLADLRVVFQVVGNDDSPFAIDL